MGLGSLRLILSLLVIDAHYEVFRRYAQPWLVERFGVDRLAYVGEGGVAISGFFVISGYVIAYVLARKYDTATWRGIGSFYLGRALRIYPLYLLVFAAFWIARASVGDAPVMSPGQLRDNLLLIPYAIYGLVRDQNQFGSLQLSTQLLIPPSWTLAIDLLLYLLAPFLVVRRTPLWIAWCIGLACFAGFVVALDPRPPVWFGYLYSTPLPYVFAFTCGALVFHHRDRFAPGVTWLVFAMLVLLWITFAPLGAPNTSLNQLIAILALTVLVACLSRYGSGKRVDRLFGDLTYATYLLHLPLLLLLERVGIAAAHAWAFVSTYAIATLLLYTLEYPLDRFRDAVHRALQRQRGRRIVASGPIAVGVSVLLLAAAVSSFVRNALQGGGNVALNASQCPLDWTCAAREGANSFATPSAGRATLAPAIPIVGRVLVDFTVPGTAGNAGAHLEVNGKAVLRAGITRTADRCDLLLEIDGRREPVPLGWSADCARTHRFVLDGSAGTTVLAVDSLWVYTSAQKSGSAQVVVESGPRTDGTILIGRMFAARPALEALTPNPPGNASAFN